MAKEVQNMQEQLNWHWRNNMRTVRFFALDARASLCFMVLLVYARTSTIILTFIVTMIFYWLEKKGMTFPAALRNLRMWFVGTDRPGLNSVHHKKFIDHG
ncbi:MAG: IcmT/TraK family protein [Alphaproteobacteria bacterium]